MYFRSALLISLSTLLFSCKSNDSQPVAALDEAIASNKIKHQPPAPLAELPAGVSSELMPELNQPKEQALLGESRYDIKAEQVPAATFFSGLVEPTAFSIAIHPEVQGNISLDLKQVTLSDVFEIVMEIYGYDVQKKGNIFTVYPSGIRTETYAVNYLLMQRDGVTQTSISTGGVSQFGNSSSGSSGGANGGNASNSSNQNSFNNNSQGGGGNSAGGGNGTNISTRSQSDFWTNLETTLKALIGTDQGRSVVVSSQAGLVTVRAMPDELRSVKRFLKTSEEHVQRQVVLEARIIEVSLSDDYQQGINWTRMLSHSGSTDLNFTTTKGTLGNTITGRLGGVTALNFLNKDFSGVVNLLSTQGDVQVLSSPRVTATNNQKAVIKVGNDEYFVTDVSSQSTVTANSTQTAPDIQLTPFFSGIALDVTPQIDKEGTVLLHVHPSVIETTEQEKTVTLNQQQYVLPLAQSNIRESDTVIRARSGEIVVIGGLMQTMKNDTESKTPLLGSIPILGELFKSRREVESKKELIILLKPTVVGPTTWRDQLKRSRQYMVDWLEAN